MARGLLRGRRHAPVHQGGRHGRGHHGPCQGTLLQVASSAKCPAGRPTRPASNARPVANVRATGRMKVSIIYSLRLFIRLIFILILTIYFVKKIKVIETKSNVYLNYFM
jgi:hypothetical protein